MQDEEDDCGYDRDDDPCDHEDHEVNLIDGRCMCYRCGECWYASAAEIDAQLSFESEYHEGMEREQRRQWWRDLFAAILGPFRRLRWRIYARRHRGVLDDGIPF